MTAERNASTAEAVAIGIAKRMAHLTPHKLMNVKNNTMQIAKTGTGNQGK